MSVTLRENGSIFYKKYSPFHIELVILLSVIVQISYGANYMKEKDSTTFLQIAMSYFLAILICGLVEKIIQTHTVGVIGFAKSFL